MIIFYEASILTVTSPWHFHWLTGGHSTLTGLWCVHTECGLLSTEGFLQPISLGGTPAGVWLELLKSAELAHHAGLGDSFHNNRCLLMVSTGLSLTLNIRFSKFTCLNLLQIQRYMRENIKILYVFVFLTITVVSPILVD